MTRQTPLELAIYKTLVYSSIFNFPLTSQEIHRYLMGVKCSYENVLDSLKKSNYYHKSDGYFSLKKDKEFIPERISRKKISLKKMNRAKRIAKFLNFIPTIQMIAISGSLSMENSKSEDDIDFFIVTSRGFLWTTRLVITLLLDLFNLRRRPKDKNVRDKICLNMFLDDTHLQLIRSDQNLYTAHEVSQLKPLVSKKNTYERFLFLNSWITNFLPNIKIMDVKESDFSNKFLNLLRLIYLPIEKLLYRVQKEFMDKKMTREVVDLHHIFFHPRDTKLQVLSKFNKTLDIIS